MRRALPFGEASELAPFDIVDSERVRRGNGDRMYQTRGIIYQMLSTHASCPREALDYMTVEGIQVLVLKRFLNECKG